MVNFANNFVINWNETETETKFSRIDEAIDFFLKKQVLATEGVSKYSGCSENS